MDNNSRGRERIRARDLTEEINQATDFVANEELPMAVGAESLSQGVESNGHQRQGNGTAGREKAQRMGWQVIDGGRRGAEMLSAAGEVVKDELELTQAQEFVGDESKIQIDERERDDAEDARSEAGKSPIEFENRIVAKNQEGVARAVAPEVDKMVNQKSFRVSDLVSLYRRAVNKMLGIFNRRIGDRN